MWDWSSLVQSSLTRSPKKNRWDEYRQDFVKRLKAIPGGWKIIKDDETGAWVGSPEDVTQIILSAGTKKLGISVHQSAPDMMKANGEKMAGKIPLIMAGLAAGTFTKYVLVFFDEFSDNSTYGKLLTAARSSTKPDVWARLHVFKGPSETTAEQVLKLCRQES
jgi:hypothetical protein